jgi:putative ATP-dependent endonuclease of the OLD family
MDIESIHFKNDPCFKTEWAGFDHVTPVTVIIGKNNTGKSHLLKLVESLTLTELGKIPGDLKVSGVLDEASLKSVFRPGTSGGELGGYHWDEHGQLLVDARCEWTKVVGQSPAVQIDPEFLLRSSRGPLTPQKEQARRDAVGELVGRTSHHFNGRSFKHLYADRDIRPEAMSNKMVLGSDGSGATNIVRRFLNSSEEAYPRELVQREMLVALNTIFDVEGRFTEIAIQHHDGKDEKEVRDEWEIFLGQEHKGLVSLSNSGSGLKTIFLVLLNLLLVPRIEKKTLQEYVFAFEELENNLHPSIVRRLLDFICSTADPEKRTFVGFPVFFLTTHSSVALDYFAAEPLAQVVHVSHDGKTGRTRTVDQTAKAYEVVWDLGTRPSDLLQANGVIWVEGPSDRIYLNRWIELYSNGDLKEGRHYQCAFYGGGLLANLQATLNDDEANSELINLLKINPNAVVISDSDRKSKRAHYKSRVRRIADEFSRLDKTRALHWILAAREIENYLVPGFMEGIDGIEMTGKPAPGQFESFFPKQGEMSFLESRMRRKSFDKSKLAALTTPHMTLDSLKTRFDLDASMRSIIGLIETWNR